MQAEEWLQQHVEELTFEELQELDHRNSTATIGGFAGFGLGVGMQMLLVRKTGLEKMLNAGNLGAKVIYAVSFSLPLVGAYSFTSYLMEKQRECVRRLMHKYASDKQL